MFKATVKSLCKVKMKFVWNPNIPKFVECYLFIKFLYCGLHLTRKTLLACL